MSSSSVVDSVMKKYVIKLKNDESSTTSGYTSSCVALVKDCEQDEVNRASKFYEQKSQVVHWKLHGQKSKKMFGLDEALEISKRILEAAHQVQR